MPINTALYYYPKPLSLVHADRFAQQVNERDCSPRTVIGTTMRLPCRLSPVMMKMNELPALVRLLLLRVSSPSNTRQGRSRRCSWMEWLVPRPVWPNHRHRSRRTRVTCVKPSIPGMTMNWWYAPVVIITFIRRVSMWPARCWRSSRLTHGNASIAKVVRNAIRLTMKSVWRCSVFLSSLHF